MGPYAPTQIPTLEGSTPECAVVFIRCLLLVLARQPFLQLPNILAMIKCSTVLPAHPARLASLSKRALTLTLRYNCPSTL